MDNDTFDRLPPKLQLAYLLGTASRMFGRETVRTLYRNTKPIVDNLVGHGTPLEQRVPGDAEDPRNNYWGGVWRVYDAD